MFDNCKSCLFYYKDYDDMYREEDDELPYDGSHPDNHFCISFQDGIPKDIWHNKTKCPHYVAK